MRNPKTEFRIPKEARKTKTETANRQRITANRNSVIGFLSEIGIRLSDFNESRFPAEKVLKFFPIRLHCFDVPGVHALVKRQCLAASGGKFRPASALVPSPDCADQRFFEAAIHRANERPGSHVRHSHLPGRFGDGTGLLHRFEQFHFTRSEGYIVADFDADSWLN